MKKVLSIVLSLCMLLSITAGIDLSAHAVEGYEGSVITSNIKKIKNYIYDNGFINGNGNYTIQNFSSDGKNDYYDLMYIDENNGTLLFKEQLYESDSDCILGFVDLYVESSQDTTQTTGYQIQYATNAKFTSAKTVTVKNTTTSKTISKLAGKKKYYVRVRTYKTVGSAKYYSAWSSAKTVTTKK